MTRALDVFSVGVSFGLTGIGPFLECQDKRGYMKNLTLFMVVPPILALLVVFRAFCGMVCEGRYNGMVLLDMALPTLLQIAFVTYPLVTNAAFGACADRARLFVPLLRRHLADVSALFIAGRCLLMLRIFRRRVAEGGRGHSVSHARAQRCARSRVDCPYSLSVWPAVSQCWATLRFA